MGHATRDIGDRYGAHQALLADAREALIPRAIWRRSDAFRLPSIQSVTALAAELRVHPAVVAGRVRKETGNYRRFSKLIGQGDVRRLFVSKYFVI